MKIINKRKIYNKFTKNSKVIKAKIKVRLNRIIICNKTNNINNNMIMISNNLSRFNSLIIVCKSFKNMLKDLS